MSEQFLPHQDDFGYRKQEGNRIEVIAESHRSFSFRIPQPLIILFPRDDKFEPSRSPASSELPVRSGSSILNQIPLAVSRFSSNRFLSPLRLPMQSTTATLNRSVCFKRRGLLSWCIFRVFKCADPEWPPQ
jgi:hypothetical protein